MRLGTWLHSAPRTREDADVVVQKLAAMGINVLITSFKNWTGPTFYPSDVAYTEKGYEDAGLYGHLVDRCHERGLAFEAWTCTFPEAGPSRLIEEHPECRVTDRSGQEYRVDHNGIAWACPSQDLTQDYELALCREVLARYPAIDGLHLDYIRYPNADTCYCEHCKREFRERYGFDLLTDVMPGGSEGKAFDAFVRWRCGHIRRFVDRARRAAHEAKASLTAAVFPYYPSIMYDLGQDWVDWCAEGLLDAVYPMTYNWSELMVGRYTAAHRHFLGSVSTLLCEGLALKRDMTSADVRRLGEAALERGAQGLIFFECRTLINMPVDTLRPFLDHAAGAR